MCDLLWSLCQKLQVCPLCGLCVSATVVGPQLHNRNSRAPAHILWLHHGAGGKGCGASPVDYGMAATQEWGAGACPAN